jgi:hypothetical protein
MSETGQPSAVLWPTLPPERKRTVLRILAELVLRRVREAPQSKEASDESGKPPAAERCAAGQDAASAL